MIEPVHTDIMAAVEAEQLRAVAIYGPEYHTTHEAFGVLSEELYEAAIEWREIKAYEGMLLSAIHKQNDQLLCNAMDMIEHHAILAACELVQAAAVCRKAIAGIKGGADEAAL